MFWAPPQESAVYCRDPGIFILVSSPGETGDSDKNLRKHNRRGSQISHSVIPAFSADVGTTGGVPFSWCCCDCGTGTWAVSLSLQMCLSDPSTLFLDLMAPRGVRVHSPECMEWEERRRFRLGLEGAWFHSPALRPIGYWASLSLSFSFLQNGENDISIKGLGQLGTVRTLNPGIILGLGGRVVLESICTRLEPRSH